MPPKTPKITLANNTRSEHDDLDLLAGNAKPDGHPGHPSAKPEGHPNANPEEISESEPVDEQEDSIQKPKRALTDKQKEALRIGREKGRIKLDELHASQVQHKEDLKQAKLSIKEQKIQRELALIEEYKQKTETKIVSKALSIKKKEIKKQAVLDEISDDDTPMEEIKKIVKKIPSKPAPIQRQTNAPLPQPQYQPPPRYLFSD